MNYFAFKWKIILNFFSCNLLMNILNSTNNFRFYATMANALFISHDDSEGAASKIWSSSTYFLCVYEHRMP